MQNVLKPIVRKRVLAWRPRSPTKQLQDQILTKIRPYWDISGVTYQNLEEEWRQQSPLLMNILISSECTNKWQKRFDSLTFGNVYFTCFIGVIDIAIQTSRLEDYVLKGFYLVGIFFSTIMHATFRNYKQEINQLQLWVENFQNPDNKIAQSLTAAQERGFKNKFQTAIKMSLFVSRLMKCAALFCSFVVFILAPIVITLVTQDVTNLFPIPFKIMFVSNKTLLGALLHLVQQCLVIYTTVSFMCLSGSLIFSLVIHSVIYMKIINDFMKSKNGDTTLDNQDFLTEDRQIWIKDVIDATDQLSE